MDIDINFGGAINNKTDTAKPVMQYVIFFSILVWIKGCPL